MTIEPINPRAVYTIASAGPFALRDSGGNPWPYTAGGVAVAVVKAGVLTALVENTDFTLSPTSGADGNLTLSTGALAAHTGGQLIITRQTVVEQGWQGVQGAREVSLAMQLDLLAMRLQEHGVALSSAFQLAAGNLPPIVLTSGRALIYEDGKIVSGPTADEIANAQGYAEDAQAAAESVTNVVGADLIAWTAAGGAIDPYLTPEATPYAITEGLVVSASVHADLIGSTITQANGENLPVLVTVNTGTGAGAVSKTDLGLFVDGNRANNSTVIGVSFDTFRKSYGRVQVGAGNCDTGVRVKGNVEFAKLDIGADNCGVGLHVTSVVGGSTPDELLIDMTAHECGTFFKADGPNKISGVVRIVAEQSDSWGVEIGSGWWNLTGEIRGVGMLGGGGYRQYEGWTDAAGEVNVTGNLMVVGGDATNCEWLVSIEKGRTNCMVFGMFGAYKNGARVLGGVSSGSSAQFIMFNYPTNGPALELGNDATLNNFHVLPGSVLSSATVAVNLVRAVNCTIDADVLFGQIVIGANSNSNIINVPRQNFSGVTVVNSRTQLDNVIVFKGRHTLTSLQGRTDLIRGMQAEAVADWSGASAYYDGARWVPSHGVIASGTATILAGSTTVAIAHGLGANPGVGAIQILSTSGLGAAKHWWLSSVTTNIINLAVDVAPGVDITFSWVVRKTT